MFADELRYRGCRHQVIHCRDQLRDAVGRSHANDGLDGDIVVVAPVNIHALASADNMRGF